MLAVFNEEWVVPETDRELGRHDADIETLKREVHELRMEVHKIAVMLSEAKGGWRMMMAVAGLSGMLGAGATKISTALGIH
jgi:hypothetical protein